MAKRIIEMKIRYKKKRFYANLILGIVWIGLGIFAIWEDDNIRWYDYGYIVFGTLYFGLFLFELLNEYLTIENGTIRKNSILGKRINLNEITEIKKFAGDYTLKTEKQELKIKTELIEKNSRVELIKILEKIKLPVDKTPFANNVYN